MRKGQQRLLPRTCRMFIIDEYACRNVTRYETGGPFVRSAWRVPSVGLTVGVNAPRRLEKRSIQAETVSRWNKVTVPAVSGRHAPVLSGDEATNFALQ
jgi:hypothetical protein